VVRKIKKKTFTPARARYPHEKQYPWLTVLLDSYAIHDYGMSKDIAVAEKTQGIRIACHEGCSACCLRSDVPISQLETMGISWYFTEIMDFETQERLIPRLLSHHENLECPLLLDSRCSVYSLRPLACRSFFVHTAPCAIGEDVAINRPEHIYRPDSSLGKRVAMRFLDCEIYGLTTRKEKEQAFEKGIMMQITRPIHTIDWSHFVELIHAFRIQRTAEQTDG
jgi:Fe-S-cluster containining protein